ncbi:MAG: hypothetical protein WC511_02635 [Candidatus Pacearchaeota archaeon]
MLLIHHKGIHINLDLDTTDFNGDLDHDSQLTYVQGLKAGRVAALDANGKVVLADGLAASAKAPIGFIVNDAAGYFMMNKPAIASKISPVTFSPCVISTTEFDATKTYTAGQKLYVDTGANVGLVTNVAPVGAKAIGISLGAAAAGSGVESGSLSIAPGVMMLKIATGLNLD